MKLTKVERLLLANQYQILSKLDPEDASHDMLREALENGYEAAYQDVLSLRILDGLSVDECRFVQEAMDLYWTLQLSYEELEAKAEIEESRTEFTGFDDNHETPYMAYARYLVEKERRFPSLKLSRDPFNSHTPMLEHYRRQIDLWKLMDQKRILTLEDMATILEVRGGPDR